jgi:hypothetical protein
LYDHTNRGPLPASDELNFLWPAADDSSEATMIPRTPHRLSAHAWIHDGISTFTHPEPDAHPDPLVCVEEPIGPPNHGIDAQRDAVDAGAASYAVHAVAEHVHDW